MADIDLFKYRSVNSKLHKFHPTLKIILLLAISIYITYGTIEALIYYTALIAFCINHTKYKISSNEIKYALFLAITILIFNILVQRVISLDIIISTLLYILRFFLIILLGSIFAYTTHPSDIAPAVYLILRNKKVSQNIAITINLIPMFILSWRNSIEGIRSRGIYLRKNPFYILRHLSIPLFIEIFKKSDQVSTAMEARYYREWVKGDLKNNTLNLYIIILGLLPYLLMIKKLLPQG